jgi:GNAT superfamily N-acetyltransferase
MACQIVHDSWHARGFLDEYLIERAGETIGYGSVGGAPGDPRETVKEFYVEPAHRGDALPLFRRLVAESGARRIEAQTNDVLLTLMLFDSVATVSGETVLFADSRPTRLPAPGGARFRTVTEAERPLIFAHTVEPVGDWAIELDGVVVATGGVLYHYNPPYGDVFMEVAEPYRRRGLASYLVQELKRVCYEGGHVPAARCHQTNVGSRGALVNAGFLPCGRIVRGDVATVGSVISGARRSGPTPRRPASGSRSRRPARG